MALTKDKLMQVIEALPNEGALDVEGLIEEIILLEKVERGLEDLKAGRVITDEDLDKQIEQW